MHVGGEIFFGCDDVLCPDLLNHRLNVLVFVINVDFFYLFHALRVNVRDDGLNRHGINHLLKDVLLPVDLVVLLELEELAPLGVVLNFRIE